MIAVFIIGLLVVIFSVAVVAPRAANKIHHKSNRKTSKLKGFSNRLWNPLTLWTKSTLEVIRRSITTAVILGKKLRRKPPFKG